MEHDVPTTPDTGPAQLPQAPPSSDPRQQFAHQVANGQGGDSGSVFARLTSNQFFTAVMSFAWFRGFHCSHQAGIWSGCPGDWP